MVETPKAASAEILVVEDDPQVRAMLRQVLEVAGFGVREASDGKDAMKRWQERPSDLVITDLLMPEMDGLEVISQLRKLSPATKIIAITGGGPTKRLNFLQPAKLLGASRTLHKPFERAELLQHVRDLLAQSA